MTPEHRRILAIGCFLLLALSVAVPFATAYSGHLSEFAMIGSDTTVTNGVVENGTLTFDMRLENPSTRPVEITGVFLIVSSDEEQYSDISGTEITETTIDPGETANLGVRIELLSGYAEPTREALNAGELSINGVLSVDIDDRTVSKDIRLDGVSDD